ncbi:MAG: Nif3-like dinuclear metal center hexameric protein [Burkholderiales bacterium]|nr:Nif3-like dinuclear metal center hexameric protein [Burkholderiales bacterium]
MSRDKLVYDLNDLLKISLFKDYCPNGLQIEGASEVQQIITGVSLNQELIDYAIAKEATAIIVHHGIFWNKSSYELTGIKYQRVAKIIKNDINLLAYHLPLDNHAEFGNNVQLAKLLGITICGQSGEQGLLWQGKLAQAMPLGEFVQFYQQQTGHLPSFFGEQEQSISTLAWCTGGADGMFADAISLGVDCFISGEISEPVMHLAKESGVAYISGGHYVTERYGIIALTDYLNSMGYDAEFIELYNPI